MSVLQTINYKLANCCAWGDWQTDPDWIGLVPNHTTHLHPETPTHMQTTHEVRNNTPKPITMSFSPRSKQLFSQVQKDTQTPENFIDTIATVG